MHVLLATADDSIQQVLRDALVAAGHDVTPARSGEEAVAALERENPPCVVLAEDLPGHPAGLDLCRWVRADARPGRERFVLVVLRDDEDRRLADALDAGVDDFIPVRASASGVAARLAARAAVAERRIAVDEAHRRAEVALGRTQRLLGIGEASAALQHEINNPLAALLAHASLLEHGLHEPGEERELLGVIVEQAHRIADVVKRISGLRYADAAAPDDMLPDDVDA